jgi:hypothetical protein
VSEVRVAAGADRAPVTQMLSRAFADDPAMSFIFPDPADRARRLPRLFALLFDSDRATGMRLVTAGGEAATLWRGPGRVHTGRLEMLRNAVPMLAAFGRALPRALALSDAIGAHMPSGDFWYLHVAGWWRRARGWAVQRCGQGLPVQRGGRHAISRPRRRRTWASTPGWASK